MLSWFMIGSLRGTVEKSWGNSVVLEVAGVGYLVWVGSKLGRKLVEGEEAKLQIHMVVSENDMSLYGFETWEELQLFRMLITVSGVGPKTGAQILSETRAEEVIRAIGAADTDFFGKIKGIGKKTAQRIIVDLKSKIGGLGELDLKDDLLPLADDDLVAALKKLGFDQKEIYKVMVKLPIDIYELEKKLEWCLQNMG